MPPYSIPARRRGRDDHAPARRQHPLVNELNAPGTSVCPKRDLSSIALWHASASLWIATSQRVRHHDAPGIPSGKLKLGNGETLLSLITH
ncbi:MAG: hypothetical protein U0703_04710 [Anaerolineae bacterium]